MITLEKIKNDPAVSIYIKTADASLEALGYTDHGTSHLERVSDRAGDILLSLGYSDHEITLAKIAGYLHDIGNLVNRIEHSQSGGIMAFTLLNTMGMPAEDIAPIVAAIGNHDEGTGTAVSAVAAALILADKSDVCRDRVRYKTIDYSDIHDRVNYSVTSSELITDTDKKTVTLYLISDTDIASVMDFFEIFASRMTMCKHAAQKLGLEFSVVINGNLIA